MDTITIERTAGDFKYEISGTRFDCNMTILPMGEMPSA